MISRMWEWDRRRKAEEGRGVQVSTELSICHVTCGRGTVRQLYLDLSTVM